MHRLAVVAFFLSLAQPSVAQMAPPDWRGSLATFAEQLIASDLAPGFGVAVSVGDRVEYTAGFGLADRRTRRAVTPETAFYIASTTKSLTAFAATLLAERGEIDLQAPISRYLPTLRLSRPLDADSITVEDLLKLTHGIADGGPVVIRTAYTGEFTNGLLLDLMAGYGPSEQGRAFVYGNLGYNLLGLLLEARLGSGWKEIVEREVLVPAGMTGTSAFVSRLDEEGLALPHAVTSTSFDRIELTKSDATMHAAGGHFATAGDLARYVAAHQSGGILEGRQVFPASAIETTHRKHVDQDRQFGPIRRYGWGYGWDLGVLDGDTLVHRFGAFAGYRSHMSFMPGHRLGVVVLVNGDGPASAAADLLASYAYDLLLGKPAVDDAYAARLAEMVASTTAGRGELARSLEVRAARQKPLRHPLADFAGTFENAQYGRFDLTLAGDRLEASMGAARSAVEVFDAESDRLRVELTGNGAVVQFLFSDEGGPAQSLTMAGVEYVRVR